MVSKQAGKKVENRGERIPTPIDNYPARRGSSEAWRGSKGWRGEVCVEGESDSAGLPTHIALSTQTGAGE
ncbi:hypothetical protein SUGI_1068380 [Cryptomeria japonica]|nr:hypothetical protein SUGI_1068380 [Cryptomeria japonica]